jgi:O-antigen ligase
MNPDTLAKYAGLTQRLAFTALLIFTPLARGATPRWAFCIALWLMLLAFFSMVLKRVWQSERLVPCSPLDLALALLVMLALGSLFTSIHRSVSGWAVTRLFLYAGVFYLALDMARSRTQTKRLIVTILCLGTALAFIGFIKYQGGTYPAFWDYRTAGEKLFLTSTFMNHNHIAGYLSMVFALGLGISMYRPFGHWTVWGAPLLLILVALCLAMSRGGWIATLFALGVMAVLIMLKKGASNLTAVVVSLAVLFAVGLTILASNPMIERMHSVHDREEPALTSRLLVWRGSVDLLRQKPFLGTGPGTFPWSFTQVRPAGLTLRFREAHNDYVQIVTEMGLLVFVPLLWGLFLLLKTALRRFKETKSRLRAGTILGSLGGVVAILLHSLSDFNIQITANGILFSVLVALAVGERQDRVSAVNG